MRFLEIRNMVKKYNDQIVLDKVNYSFPSTGLFVIIGESGSGKSTFINCLCGIEKMDKGEIYFLNKKIKNFEKFRNKYIGNIYQNYNLISFFNVKDNVSLLGEQKDLNLFNLNKFINTKINVLSGGENQRIGISRALNSKKRIILCDEPTGSLDKNNAQEVMKILKDISKTNLVIIVSHNMELMKKYNPIILKIENHKLIGEYIKEDKIEFKHEKLKFLKMGKIIKTSIKTLIHNPLKMITSIISLSLSFSFLLLTYSCSSNISKIIEENKTLYLDYTTLSICKESSYKIDNSSLTLVKEERLDRKNVNELSYAIDLSSYHYDLSPIFSSFPLINHPINTEYYLSNIEWVPYFQSNEINFKNKIDGRFPLDENEVVINSACEKYFSSSRFLININKNIDLKLSNNLIITDEYEINMRFNIVGKVEEFDLLQTPKIYYPYNYLLKLSKEIVLPNLSKHYGLPITLYDRLSTIRGEDDSFSSTRYLIECKSDETEKIYNSVNSLVKENESFKVYSQPLSKLKTFENMFSSILLVLKIFLSITLIISVLLLALVIFSYILDYKKDIGIMLGCGVLKFDVTQIFVMQSLFLSSISMIISFCIYKLFSQVINSFLFDLIGINVLENFVSNKMIFILFMFCIFISLFLSILIVNKITKLNISNILKED